MKLSSSGTVVSRLIRPLLHLVILQCCGFLQRGAHAAGEESALDKIEHEGWLLALNLATSDGRVTSYYQNTFWESTAASGGVSTDPSNALLQDFKDIEVYGEYPARQLLALLHHGGVPVAWRTFELQDPASPLAAYFADGEVYTGTHCSGAAGLGANRRMTASIIDTWPSNWRDLVHASDPVLHDAFQLYANTLVDQDNCDHARLAAKASAASYGRGGYGGYGIGFAADAYLMSRPTADAFLQGGWGGDMLGSVGTDCNMDVTTTLPRSDPNARAYEGGTCRSSGYSMDYAFYVKGVPPPPPPSPPPPPLPPPPPPSPPPPPLTPPNLGGQHCCGSGGTDHAGGHWIIDSNIAISGIHCNLGLFEIKSGVTVTVIPWNGTHHGTIQIFARYVHILGTLTATGSGYKGGARPTIISSGGYQGESSCGTGNISQAKNCGGGGGGSGETQGQGRPGGGGGAASVGSVGGLTSNYPWGGEGGSAVDLETAITQSVPFLGPGGGSGGNDDSVSSNPLGGLGGAGGGGIRLRAFEYLRLTGAVYAQGAAGQGSATCSSSSDTTTCWDLAGPGGGGAGGTIILHTVTATMASASSMNVSGGTGGQSHLGSNLGGDGGNGWEHIETSDSNVYNCLVPPRTLTPTTTAPSSVTPTVQPTTGAPTSSPTLSPATTVPSTLLPSATPTTLVPSSSPTRAPTTVGEVYAVGDNDSGQLGDGSGTNQSRPVLAATSGNVVQVAAWDHTVFRTSLGQVLACGSNAYGQLGLGSGNTTNIASPVRVMVNFTVAHIAAGHFHTLFVTSDAEVYGVGRNSEGQLGTGGTNVSHDAPVMIAVSSSASGVVHAAAGRYHSVFVLASGKVYALGHNSAGQLGDGTRTARRAAVQVALSSASGAQVVAGCYHTVILTADGQTYMTGKNDYGQLGDGSTTWRSTPVRVMSSHAVKAAAAGWHHTLFLTTDGQAYATGRRWTQQQSDQYHVLYPDGQISTPVQVMSGQMVTQIAAGAWHSLFVTAASHVYSGGRNYEGQLGDGTRLVRIEAAEVPILTTHDVGGIGAGHLHSVFMAAGPFPATATPTATLHPITSAPSTAQPTASPSSASPTASPSTSPTAAPSPSSDAPTSSPSLTPTSGSSVALGMQSGAIADSQISASSEHRDCLAASGRLASSGTYSSSTGSQGAWCAASSASGEWLQVDLESSQTVHGISTQGRHDAAQWVTSYQVQGSIDGVTWTDALEQVTGGRNFTGNSDQTTTVFRRFSTEIAARYLRVYPLAWNSYIAMRVELYSYMYIAPPPPPRQLALAIDGNSNTFSYSSSLWTSTNLYSSGNQAKTEAFFIPTTTVELEMVYAATAYAYECYAPEAGSLLPPELPEPSPLSQACAQNQDMTGPMPLRLRPP
ncbi:hypothetical protein CYMTET_25572 [Cymbomonas tetramitiformis]|uniref:F5/8 type C domain-containing protein n=1 Tax=Cymbomonas tetramitiformis TaxID=36881 RepID=A0AAE0KYX1_9CHLO|nr:hypothetical protein CYMTET_25572 [Cymbomonas tetramitiformis]